MTVTILSIKRRYGIDITAYATEDLAKKALENYCRRHWHEFSTQPIPIMGVVEAYTANAEGFEDSEIATILIEGATR